MNLKDTAAKFLSNGRLNRFKRQYYKDWSSHVEFTLFTDDATFNIDINYTWNNETIYTARHRQTGRYIKSLNETDIFDFIDTWNHFIIVQTHPTVYDKECYFNSTISSTEFEKIFDQIRTKLNRNKVQNVIEISVDFITDEGGGLSYEFKSYRYENEQEREKRLEAERKKTEERELKRLQRLEKEQQEKQSKIDRLKAELAALENS